MKKLVSILIATVVCFSLSACSMGKSNNGTNYGGTNIGGTAGLNNNANINYKDGVYTALGNVHDGINESATVEIRSGKIINVALNSTAQQSGTNNQYGIGFGDMIGNITGSRTNNQDMTGESGRLGNMSGNGSALQGGAAYDGTLNNITGTEVNRQGGTMGNTAGRESYNPPGSDNQSGAGAGSGSVVDSFNQAKADLITAIIQNQNPNVDVTSYDSVVGASVDNWKLAVTRALDQAR